jgi:hypothetical protein
MKPQTNTTKKQSLIVRGSMNRVTRLFLLAFICIACIGLSTAQTTPPSDQQLSAEELQRLDDWHVSIAQVPSPSPGCFEAEYPSLQWREVGCVAPSNYLFLPKEGPRPFVVGKSNDISAQAPTGHIITAIGSFDTATTGVTGETGQVNGKGGQVADAYSLQLNTDTFVSTAICAGASNPSICRGWEQFIYGSDGTAAKSVAFIQYWILGWDQPTCPPGWFGPVPIPGGHTGCVRNSSAVAVPNQPITNANLPKLALSGNVTATSDSVTMTYGGGAKMVTGNNYLAAAAGWTISEFNIFGDGGGGQANIQGAGAHIVTKNRIIYGGNAPPNCVVRGYSGETNNLNFASAPAASSPGPAIIFSQDNPGLYSANCAYASSVGDTHLDTVLGLHYDFQASGDFVVAQVDQDDFIVEERQVSGAPSWPNAAVNHAVATQMGRDVVAVCLNSFRGGSDLFVNYQFIDLGDGQVYSTPDGVDIWRFGNAYNITDQNGNSVKAVTNPTWMDVSIGLGRWPASLTGLIANANGNVNQIGARAGTVLTAPFSFGQFYPVYGDSWRAPFDRSLLWVCGEQTAPGNPQTPFYATDLPLELYNSARSVCTAAGVRGNPLLDSCTLDVAVIGDDAAADFFITARQPVAVGYIVSPKKCSHGCPGTSGSADPSH